MMKHADIVAKVSFLPTAEGGRESPTPAMRLGCIFGFEQGLYDCALMLQSLDPIFPGDTVLVPIVFLDPDAIKPKLAVGDGFVLRDYRIFARGTVESIE